MNTLTVTSLVLVAAVIFVNGLTDAPNSIATAVTTRCISVRGAVILSALFNLLGVSVTGLRGSAVAETVMTMVDFGNDREVMVIALAGALFSIVLWAVVAWFFGIPTSESHALIAGLSGSALSLRGNLSAINPHEWAKAIYGLFLSCAGGFICGIVICRAILIIFRNMSRSRGQDFFRFGQMFSAGAMSFMHGAQDGQKFMAVSLLCAGMNGEKGVSSLPVAVVLATSLLMASGTLFGGKRIIKSVGMDMVRLQRYQGFSADLSGALSLLVSTLMGLPVSTTHAKTSAMVGCAFAENPRKVNVSVIKDMMLTWIFTFPGCGALGYLMTKLFLCIF